MMLPYHESFKQLRAGAWAGPLTTSVGYGFMLWGHGLRPAELVWFWTGVAVLIVLFLVEMAIWVSVWGTRHQYVVCLGAFLFFVVPFSILLVPFLQAGDIEHEVISAGIVITLGVALVLSAVYHYWRAQMPAQARVLKWPGVEIDLRQYVIRHSPAASGAVGYVTAALGAGLSVTLYHFLNALLPNQSMIILGIAIGFGMGLWLCLWLLGRALGQAWRLRQIEKRESKRFVTDRQQWLTQERQRSVIGRWWARRFS